MSQKPAIVIFGDGQAFVLSHGLKRLPEITEKFDVFHMWAVKPHETALAEPPIPAEVWQRCEAFWMQIGVAPPPPHYAQGAPDRRITFSSLDLPFAFPFYAADLVMRPTARHPMGFGYADRFLVELSETDLTGDAIYLRYEELQQRHLVVIDNVLENGTRRMSERDADASVKIAGYALSHTCDQRLAWTRMHPTEAMSAVQLDRLLRATFSGQVNRGQKLFGAGARAFAEPHALSAQQDPVSWTVADRLGLAWWRPDHRYRISGLNTAMTLRDFVVAYVTERRRKLAEQGADGRGVAAA